MEQNVYLDKTKLDEIESMVNSLIESMDIDGMKAKLRDLNDKQMEEGFWDDTESAQKTIKEFNHYNRKIENLKSLTDEISSLKDLLEIMEMEGDYSSYKDFKDDLIKLEKHAEDFKIATLLNDKYDDKYDVTHVCPSLSYVWLFTLTQQKGYSTKATTRAQPAEAALMLTGKQLTLKPVTGS